MRAIIEPVRAPPPGSPHPPLLQRLSWFAALALGGIGLTALAAYGLYALLRLR